MNTISELLNKDKEEKIEETNRNIVYIEEEIINFLYEKFKKHPEKKYVKLTYYRLFIYPIDIGCGINIYLPCYKIIRENYDLFKKDLNKDPNYEIEIESYNFDSLLFKKIVIECSKK